MKAPPSIKSMKFGDDWILTIEFKGVGVRFVDMKKFPYSGTKAKAIGESLENLRSFKLVEGGPEYDGLGLLAPEDLIAYSVTDRRDIFTQRYKDAGSYEAALDIFFKDLIEDAQRIVRDYPIPDIKHMRDKKKSHSEEED